MKNTLTLLAILPMTLSAQTTWEVVAGGSTAPGQPDPYYDPMELTIYVGDSVHWHAVSGSHNVYAEADDFPANPEYFSSGEPTQDLDYTRLFTVPGEYGYHCTQQGHSATQHGTITVLENNTHVLEQTSMGTLSLYPVPASGQLNIKLEGGSLVQAEVFGMDGRLQRTRSMISGQRNVLDVSGLGRGRYMLRLLDIKGQSLVRAFMKD